MSETEIAPTAPVVAVKSMTMQLRIQSLTSCLVNINTHLQPELGINTMQIFQLTTLLCKYVDQLDYLLFNNTSQYVGLLADGYQMGEYSDILFLISTWCMEVLLKSTADFQLNLSPDTISKIARAVMIQMILSADNLLQLSEDDKKNVLIIIGMNEILNDSTLLLFPLVQNITDSLMSCCLSRPKPNVRKNAQTYKTTSQFLVKHHRH
jgi:hypothetical protein